jgi:3-(3-hydroxy-phenyl)propionate hydroxylase
MTEHAVVIAGGGPTGLLLAGELALAGVDVAIVERRATQEVAGPRARGLHARTLEVFDQRGIVERFLAEGQQAQIAGFGGVALDMSDFPSRHPYGLALWQGPIERILAGWAAELGVKFYRGRDVTRFIADESCVDIELSDGEAIRAAYLVGCDGGRSMIRKMAGIEFPGLDPTTSNLLAEVELTEEPEWGLRRDAHGIHALTQMADGRRVSVLVTEQQVGSTLTDPTLQDLSEALIAVYGTDYGAHSPTWISRFTDMTRQAATYRKGRILVAGDAAHIQPPDGGQGIQLGLQDAMNLGWKLGQVIRQVSPESLLDTYHAERHPVAARALRNSQAQVVLRRADERMQALRDTMADLLSMEEPRKRFAAMMSGLDIRYDLGEGHPLLGRRMPDLELRTGSGLERVYPLLHAARPILLKLGDIGEFDLTPWESRVATIAAQYDGSWELPAIGFVAAPAAVLIRPDGYVAWVGDGTDTGLREALTRWFGAP